MKLGLILAKGDMGRGDSGARKFLPVDLAR